MADEVPQNGLKPERPLTKRIFAAHFILDGPVKWEDTSMGALCPADRASASYSPARLDIARSGDGPRDAEVNGVLGVLERAAKVLQAPDESTARRAGRLRYLAKTYDGIDALVAAAAVGDGSPAVVLTSDPDDLARLLQRERQVSVRPV